MPVNEAHQPEITLVGAGLVGSLLSLYLAKRGWGVRLFERRPDLRVSQIAAGRSINLAVSARGIHALQELGLEAEVLEQAVPMRGRMMHSVSGELTYQPYGMNDSQCIYSISRAGLNRLLLSRAEATGKVRIHFNERAVGADLEAKKLSLKNEVTGETKQVTADVLIGTDGSASVIRSALAGIPGNTCDESLLDYGYKELVILPKGDGLFRMERNALHIWPRGTFMLIALPNFDGSFTCTLFLPFKGPVSFEKLTTPAEVEAFFQTHFSDAVPLMDDLTGTFFTNPTGSMVTVKAFPWSHRGSRTLLLGDAAHAIVPFFGQGMNCGFEDCTVLDQLLSEFDGDWDRLFERFGQLRKRNADAIADMAVENFTEMRDKVGDPRFLMEKAVEKILQARFPEHYVSRYSLVTFHRVPYQVALKAGVLQNEILAELCSGLGKPEDVDLVQAEKLIREKLSFS